MHIFTVQTQFMVQILINQEHFPLPQPPLSTVKIHSNTVATFQRSGKSWIQAEDRPACYQVLYINPMLEDGCVFSNPLELKHF